jgi:murein DD-endopeptidase MepM/ murein hydrolase activator NlpD
MFKKEKYKFNPNTLQYEKIKFSFTKFVLGFFRHSLVSLLMGVGFVVLFVILYPKFRQNLLEKENEFLKENLKELSLKVDSYNKQLDQISKNDNNIYRSLFGLPKDTVGLSLRESGTGGSDKYAYLDGYTTSELIKKTLKNIDKIETKLKVQEKSQAELLTEVANNQKFFKNAPVLQPICPNEVFRIASDFGYRAHPILGIMQFHKGIDISAETGTKVYAAGGGVVTVAGSRHDGYGNNIVINHKVRGLSTRYAHLSTMLVKVGETITRGQLIGTVGNTGLSTAPHLHYEIMKNGEVTNPLRFMFAPSVEVYDMLVKESRYKSISLD